VVRFHREKNALVTLTLKEVPSPSPYGVIITDDDGRVREFREPSEAQKKALAANPNVEPTGVDYINAGIYVMQPEAIDAIPTGRSVSIERETYPQFLKADKAVYAVGMDGFWLDIGRPEQYREATNAILNRDIAVDVPGEWTVGGYWAEDGAEVDPTAHIAPTVHIGKRARVLEGSSISGKTVIGANCEVGPNASLVDCILEEGVRVGEGARLTGVICDNNVQIEPGVLISVPCVFASGSVVAKGTRIAPGAPE